MIGVKSYPRGVTTNSESGIESYDIYYPVFQAMEEEGMVLNLHGEIPSDADKVPFPPISCFHTPSVLNAASSKHSTHPTSLFSPKQNITSRTCV